MLKHTPSLRTASLCLFLTLGSHGIAQEGNNTAPPNPPPTTDNGSPPRPSSGTPGGGGFGSPFGGGPGGFGGRGPRGASGSEAELIKIDGDKVSLQFPNNSIIDILGIYERLTNKTLVKDTAIFEGQAISLVTPQPVLKDEAVKLIEAALLTNGYAIVADPNGKSATILPTKTQNVAGAQFSQGVTFYQSADDLPDAETIVSYFMPLVNLDPTQAATTLGNHVGLNVYGRITPVLTPPGLLITENSNIVRQLVKIKEVIDVPANANSLVTKFVPLKYADAATVAQIITATLEAQATESEEKGVTTLRGQSNAPQNNPNQQQQNQQRNFPNQNAQNQNAQAQKIRISSQVIADARLNQLLIVAEPEDYTYITSLVAEFDKPVDVPEAYERKLKNVYSVDVISVLADLLKENASAVQLPGGGTLNQAQQQLISSNNQLLTGRNGNNNRGGTFSNTTGSSDSGAAARPDQLIEAEEDNAPVAVLVNKTRIIADPLANSIIVIGAKEDQDKVDMLLDKLDRKPPQVYLSTVIGQLTLGNEFELGVNYLQRFTRMGNNSGMTSGLITRNDVISGNNISDMTTNAITTAIGNAYGFNLYGQIGDSVDVFISALESNNNFKVLSRPSVFALNNKKAVITSGQSIPVPVESLTNASSVNGNNGNVTTSIDYKDVVLKLEVIPLINPDGNVTLKVAQVNDTVIGNQVVAQNDVPIIGTEQLTTTVTVPSGNTIVIGGLISEYNQKVTNGIPVLSRIPGLGRAFREDSDKVERKELIIFIQPQVVDSEGQLTRASYNEDTRTKVGAEAAKVFPTNASLTPDKNNVETTQQPRKKKFLGIFNRGDN